MNIIADRILTSSQHADEFTFAHSRAYIFISGKDSEVMRECNDFFDKVRRGDIDWSKDETNKR